MEFSPIFVHSLFRAGSTYLFSAFRRSPAGYWCYQEPLHEYIRYAAEAPERLLDVDFHVGSSLRHPILQKPYFWELYEIRDAIAPLFRKELSYDLFFAHQGDPSFEFVAIYVRSLLEHARGRPMLQCCRSFGRAAALRRHFGGKHVHLWRNPWDQWWSYQVDVYFEATNQLILNATDLPPILRSVKQLCAIGDFHDPNIEIEIAHASGHRLHARHAYLVFYSLWLYALMEMEKVADVSVNIDMLSSSAAYRRRTLAALNVAGVGELDFSDCHIAQAGFGDVDRTFFESVETDVHTLFAEHGCDAADLAFALRCRADHRPSPRHTSAGLAEDAARMRQVAVKQNDRLADSQRAIETHAVALARGQQFAEILKLKLDDARGDLGQRAGEISILKERLAGLKLELDAATSLAAIRHEQVRGLTGQLALRNSEITNAATNADMQHRALLSTKHYAANLESELSAEKSHAHELHREMTRWSNVANDTYNHLQAVYATRSWRLTAPLRWLRRTFRMSRVATKSHSFGLISVAQSSVARLVVHIARYLHTRPVLKIILVRMLARFPGYYQKIRSIAFNHGLRHHVASATSENHAKRQDADLASTHESSDLDRCSPSVLRTYRLLVAARETPTAVPVESARGPSPN